ncbi:hypothetical protein J5X84_42295 [Streptosporangiaceae bacterium NEAU-GS5]|nr:hypothetical protein [Streptosporangiaceae bacterium NEAU-GS5]
MAWYASIAAFVLPLVTHLALGRHRLVLTGYLITAALVLGHALVYSPFYDPSCLSVCEDRPLVWSWPVAARAIEAVWAGFCVVFGATAAAFAVARFTGMTPAARRVGGLVPLPAAATAVAFVLYGVARLRDPQNVPATVIYVGAACLAAVGLALLTQFGTTMLRRAALARLATDLGSAPRPGTLQAVLARLTGDPALAVAYWLPTSGRYVDATGKTVDTGNRAGRETTSIVRDGMPVATVTHGPGSRALSERIGAAARLAIDNERLRAEVLAQIEDLRASRARIVATGDQARRQLERDLHDGAQQRLLAVAYELRLADQEQCLPTVLDALRDLRELAHGIFPAILNETGLASALWSLADRAPVPVELGDIPETRFPPGVEQAAYLIVQAVADAASGPIEVDLEPAVEHLVLTVTGTMPSLPGHLHDRVGALGGQLTLLPGGANAQGTLRAEMPCA